MSYPAKLLLFGEHTILRGSRALAAPFPARSGRWAWGGPQQRLAEMAAYLQAGWAVSELDTTTFVDEVAAGLSFVSDIPTGYGLGSSGALCAAIFDRYASTAYRQLPPPALKQALARMEAFFHGASSGVDPLVSYLGRPLCLYPDGQVAEAELPALPAPYRFFLLDTGIARQTGPLVQWFLAQYDTEPAFGLAAAAQWLPATEAAIAASLAADAQALWEAFTAISAFQLTHLTPMVLPPQRAVWEQGLASQSTYRLKLCGAGGGGYLLGITRHWGTTRAELAAYPLLEV